ncbi:MAG: RloB family protein [Clostridium sp.]|nr:RloB family protein [Clostridium sp.]
MSRTQLSQQRLYATKEINIGRIIIFCEGKTEKYYFDYFAEIINKNKYNNIEVVDKKLTKRQIYNRLTSHLHSSYSKGHKGKTREIIQNGDIEKAIDNANTLTQQYANEGKSMTSNIKEMNPFTSVYVLIEQFMVRISSPSSIQSF